MTTENSNVPGRQDVGVAATKQALFYVKGVFPHAVAGATPTQTIDQLLINGWKILSVTTGGSANATTTGLDGSCYVVLLGP